MKFWMAGASLVSGFRWFCPIAAFAFLSACVSLAKTVPFDAAPTGGSGYIAGEFSKSRGSDISFTLINVDTNEVYRMPFGSDSSSQAARHDEIIALQVPPGLYKLSSWAPYATLTKARMSHDDFNFEDPFTKPFNVSSGQVAFLGAFVSEQTDQILSGTVRSSWSIRRQPATLEQEQSGFSGAYPKLAGLPFACIFCN